ncbi:MAG: E3 ubiquitin protein ligase [Candidatus Heimdallarchaeota archaeon]|nr:E3 ubiquitin protein ligase [Candidatus Heimdallarchaeota archaeon]
MANTFWVLLIIGIVLYKLFKSDSSDKKKHARRQRRQSNLSDPYSVRPTGRNTPKDSRKESSRTNTSFIKSAKRQEQMNNYDEASQLYLRGGQVYSAAKMKAMKGPIGAEEAIKIVQINSPDQVQMVTRNLVNEFYYRLNQPATAAALLRSIDLVDEAIAVEVAAGIAPQSPNVTPPAEISTEVKPEAVVVSPQIEEINEVAIVADVPETKEAVDNGPTGEINIQNTLMMASVTLSDNCIVCRRNINSGDSFLQCQTCGKPGHYKHIAEMIKVTGKCPNCKERLVMSMFSLK